MFCTLSLSSRWSTLTLHSSISVLEPKIWLPGCWSTTLCKDCPSRESCITPGWWSAPPRSQQPWTTKSHQNEPFGSPPPNVWGWSSAEHWLLCAADLSKSAYMPTTKSLHVYVFVILSHFVTFFLPFFFFFFGLLTFSCLTNGILLPVNISLCLCNYEILLSFSKMPLLEIKKINYLSWNMSL